MNVEFDLITGLSLGAEYVQADPDAGIEYSCFVIDLIIFRFVIELTGSR
jgi:hypothetical protein